jgi:uncharacterized protein (UPF0335 family)
MLERPDPFNGDPSTPLGDNAAAQLLSFVERVERLEEEKRALGDDVKEVLGEAKGVGFDPKMIRKVVKIRSMDRDKRREEEEILRMYLTALGLE